METTVIWWIRRDLRLLDNRALATALELGRTVVPLFVLDPKLLEGSLASARRNAFLFAALAHLDAELRARGSRLIVRRGDPGVVVPAVAVELGARLVVAERDYTPYARRRDEAIGRTIPLVLTDGLTIHPPERIRASNGAPYTVFASFWRAWSRLPAPTRDVLLVPPDRFVPLPDVVSEPIPHSEEVRLSWEPSEAAARQRLATFCRSQLDRYHQQRNALDGSGSSQLSPYFRFGLLSPRVAWVTVASYLAEPATRDGAAAWLRELVWREFFQALLAAYPSSPSTSLRTPFRAVSWPGDPAEFDRWREGWTGYPVVDAAMRQLATTGWISNRARMIVANFLTRLLLVDWRLGERWFRQQLLDGDLAANVGGWQWSAGTGTDAAPYFRIFNPVSQGRNFDPTGDWIRRWVPELARVPEDYLYAPWTMPLTVQLRCGCRIGREYPQPMVEYQFARQRALEWYRQVLGSRSLSTDPREGT